MITSTLEPSVDLNKLELSKHAVTRIKQRAHVSSNNAISWVRQTLEASQYIGANVSEEGSICRAFSDGKNIVLVDAHKDVVVTILKPRTNLDVRSKMRKYALKELESQLRKCERRKNKIERHRADLEEELSDVRRRLSRARSQQNKIILKSRLDALIERINELPDEAMDIQRDFTRYSQAMGLYV